MAEGDPASPWMISKLQWGAIIAALGLLSGTMGYWVNAHLTIQSAVRDIGEIRANGRKLVEQMQADIKGNATLLEQTERRMAATEAYIARLVDLADQRSDLMTEFLVKVDPAIGAEAKRLRRREQLLLNHPPPTERGEE